MFEYRSFHAEKRGGCTSIFLFDVVWNRKYYMLLSIYEAHRLRFLSYSSRLKHLTFINTFQNSIKTP
jgi:hypothetical protein